MEFTKACVMQPFPFILDACKLYLLHSPDSTHVYTFFYLWVTHLPSGHENSNGQDTEASEEPNTEAKVPLCNQERFALKSGNIRIYMKCIKALLWVRTVKHIWLIHKGTNLCRYAVLHNTGAYYIKTLTSTLCKWQKCIWPKLWGNHGSPYLMNWSY